MNGWPALLIASALLSLAPAALRAADAPEPPPGASEEAQKVYWQDRARRLQEQIDDAVARLDHGRAEYARGRHHRKIRGEHKVDVLTEIARAEADLIEARRSLEQLPEQARRAGAEPGWLRDINVTPLPEDLEPLLIEAAGDPEQHRTVARLLRARAARLRDRAEGHREMGMAYEGTKFRNAEEQRRHCDRLAELEARTADEYERLAEGHDANAQ